MVTSRYTIKLLPHYLLSLCNVIVYVARQCLRYLGISDTDPEYMWGWGGGGACTKIIKWYMGKQWLHSYQDYNNVIPKNKDVVISVLLEEWGCV